MSRLQLLLQQRADLVAEGAAIFDALEADERKMTEEEAERDEAIEVELKALDDDISRAQRQVERVRQMEVVADPNAPTATETASREGQFATFGEQLQAIAHAAVSPQSIDPRLTFQAAVSGMSEGVPSDGGFLVQQDFSQELMRRVHTMGQIMSRVRNIPISASSNGLKINAVDETSRATGSRWGGVRAYWLAEADQITKSKPTFRQMELDLKKLGAFGYMTDELLQDAAALEAVMMTAFSEEIVFMTEDAIVNGTGAGQPLGFMNGGALITIAKESGQLANTLVVENIVKMWARCDARSRAIAVWLIDQSIEVQLLTMGITFGTGGQAVYMPAGNIAGSPFASLMGRPLVPTEYNAALGTKGDIILADLSQYLTIDKGAPQGASSIHIRFDFGETAFRVIWRVDGQPVVNNPLTPKSGGDTISPFVTLATRG